MNFSLPLPDEAQRLTELYVASRLKVKFCKQSKTVFFGKHDNKPFKAVFNLLLTSLTCFLSNQLHHPSLALISNWLNKNKAKTETSLPQLLLHTKTSLETLGISSLSSHHIRVCVVGQTERVAVMLLLQFGVSKVELVQSVADVAALLQSLGVLWKLQQKQLSQTQKMQHIQPHLVIWSTVTKREIGY